MNRDPLPTGPDIALAFAELLSTARAAVRPGMAPAEAVPAVLASLGRVWHLVPPEAARDALATAAELACQAGIAELPELPASLGRLDIADGMIELTAEWISAGRPAALGAGFTPPLAYASSSAFDRDDDQATLASLAALLAVAFTALPVARWA